MWESPNWIGPAISAKVKLKSDRESRDTQREIADQDRAAAMERAKLDYEARIYGYNTQSAIADADRAIRKQIADEDRASRELISQNELANRVTVASMQTNSSETIARLNRELTQTENQRQREWQSGENQLDRANKLEVAGISAASGLANQGVRLIPFFVGKVNNSSNGNQNTTPKSKPPLPATVAETATESKRTSAREKADNLFPDLEPTFGTSNSTLPTINKNRGIALSGSAMSGLATLVLGTALTLVPFI